MLGWHIWNPQSSFHLSGCTSPTLLSALTSGCFSFRGLAQPVPLLCMALSWLSTQLVVTFPSPLPVHMTDYCLDGSHDISYLTPKVLSVIHLLPFPPHSSPPKDLTYLLSCILSACSGGDTVLRPTTAWYTVDPPSTLLERMDSRGSQFVFTEGFQVRAWSQGVT